MKRTLLLSLCCLLLSAGNLHAQLPNYLWGIPWPSTPDASEYADFDFDQVVEKYPGSAWLMEGNRHFYGVGGAKRDFRKAMECYKHAAEFCQAMETDTEEASGDNASADGSPEIAEQDTTAYATAEEYDEPSISGGEWTEDTLSVVEEGNFGNDITLADGKHVWLAPSSYLNHTMALCYAFGLGTAPDTEKAVEWGKSGEPDAWITAGIALYRAQRYAEAYELFEATAEETPYGHLWLSECKLRGRGTEENAKEAVRELESMLEQYAEDDQPDLVAAICTRLSECYTQGVGTRTNAEKAAAYKERAAKAAAQSRSQAYYEVAL